MNQYRIRPISPIETHPLRASILRPGYPPELSIYPTDLDPTTYHAGAFWGDELVGIASLNREPPPFSPEPCSWRLRGMAVGLSMRNHGIGKQLVNACVEYAQGHGGVLIWCNARQVAAYFYQSCGFKMHGEVFNIPESGPHHIMWRELTSRSDDTGSSDSFHQRKRKNNL